MASGRFINKTYKENLHSVSDAMKDILNNPYYGFIDQKGTEVDYYNINPDRSSMDEAAKIIYSQLGINSPIRYNYVSKYILYGIERISLQLENGEYGLESSEITGEAIILPNTLHPYPGDYFVINHLSQKCLFKVLSCNIDTLDDNSNLWKIEYKLEGVDDKKIKELVVDRFEFNLSTIGTRFKSVIRKEKYDMAELIEKVSTILKNYFISLYYDYHVQTFVYMYTEDNFIYDPFLIEFLMKHKSLTNSDNGYLFISHMIPINASFIMDYRKSIFYAFEERDMQLLSCSCTTTIAEYIDDMVSIFSTRAENYYKVINNTYGILRTIDRLPILDDEFIDRICNKKYYEKGELEYLNIIIRYFHKEIYTEDEITALYKLSYREDNGNKLLWNHSFFYILPLLIYCLDIYEEELLL